MTAPVTERGSWRTVCRRAAGGLLVVLALGGCAARRAPRATLVTLAGPHFAFGRHELSHEGRLKVWAAAHAVNQQPTRRVLVSGFTDSYGSEHVNLRLSQRRAEAVRDALVADGVAATRITTQAYGASNPVASNATAEGRAQNRRVEIALE